jgi:ribosome biogenesis protein Nip4
MSAAKPIEDFADGLGVRLRLDESLVVRRGNRYYLLNECIKRLKLGDFFHAGVYLGKLRGKVFFPSFQLLAMVAEKDEARRVLVDGKAEWLFVCGRDVFRRGVVSVVDLTKGGAYTLVLNVRGECLGFGRIMRDIEGGGDRDEVVIKNIADVGDFLRREK